MENKDKKLLILVTNYFLAGHGFFEREGHPSISKV